MIGYDKKKFKLIIFFKNINIKTIKLNEQAHIIYEIH